VVNKELLRQLITMGSEDEVRLQLGKEAADLRLAVRASFPFLTYTTSVLF
jgi:hypothetical protein